VKATALPSCQVARSGCANRVLSHQTRPRCAWREAINLLRGQRPRVRHKTLTSTTERYFGGSEGAKTLVPGDASGQCPCTTGARILRMLTTGGEIDFFLTVQAERRMLSNMPVGSDGG